MTIVYVKFDVSIHALKLGSEADIETLRLRIKELLSEYHPAGYSNILNDDVEVEVIEYAGPPNVCHERLAPAGRARPRMK